MHPQLEPRWRGIELLPGGHERWLLLDHRVTIPIFGPEQTKPPRMKTGKWLELNRTSYFDDRWLRVLREESRFIGQGCNATAIQAGQVDQWLLSGLSGLRKTSRRNG